MGRQRRLRLDDNWFRVDLVFFYRRLRCLVIIDLKVDRFSYADAGQMLMYLNYAREHWKKESENPSVGVILAPSEGDVEAHYALERLNITIMAREYRMTLPDEHELHTGIGSVRVQVLKARSRDGKPVSFPPALVPPYVRKCRSLEAALPWLDLKGVSSGEMHSGLELLFSASTVSRLKRVWAEEYNRWSNEPLDRDRWVYVWVDGIHGGLRAEDARLWALVVMGVKSRVRNTFWPLRTGIGNRPGVGVKC